MKELTLEAIPENISAVTAFVDGELEALDCPMKAQLQMDVAIDELFSNIALYAYGGQPGSATVRFDFDEKAKRVSLTFIDRGKPFDPLAKEDPDVSLSAEEREIGGLGIYLVKNTMDRVDYQFQDGCNMLTIEKQIG